MIPRERGDFVGELRRFVRDLAGFAFVFRYAADVVGALLYFGPSLFKKVCGLFPDPKPVKSAPRAAARPKKQKRRKGKKKRPLGYEEMYLIDEVFWDD